MNKVLRFTYLFSHVTDLAINQSTVKQKLTEGRTSDTEVSNRHAPEERNPYTEEENRHIPENRNTVARQKED